MEGVKSDAGNGVSGEPKTENAAVEAKPFDRAIAVRDDDITMKLVGGGEVTFRRVRAAAMAKIQKWTRIDSGLLGDATPEAMTTLAVFIDSVARVSLRSARRLRLEGQEIRYSTEYVDLFGEIAAERVIDAIREMDPAALITIAEVAMQGVSPEQAKN